MSYGEFAKKFKINKGSLVAVPDDEQNKTILMFKPSYSSRQQGKNYFMYCLYQLVRYKPWVGDNWHDVFPQEPEDIISEYKEFLESPEGSHLFNSEYELEKATAVMNALNEGVKFVPDEDEYEEDSEMMLHYKMIDDTLNEKDDKMEHVVGAENWILGETPYPQEYLDDCEYAIQKLNTRIVEGEINIEEYIESNIDLTLKLNEAQQLLYDLVDLRQKGKIKKPVLAICAGTAGTGKSFTIERLKHLLGDNVILTGTTGVAGFNIKGSTIHSAVSIPLRSKKGSDLKGMRLKNLQNKLRNVDWIIIDEKSMLGQRHLYWIDRRLQQIKCSKNVFGGMNVILIGDFAQLPPVGDAAMFVKRWKT